MQIKHLTAVVPFLALALAEPTNKSDFVSKTLSNGNPMKGYVDNSWQKQGSIRDYLKSRGISENNYKAYDKDQDFYKVETFIGVPYGEFEGRFTKSKISQAIWPSKGDATYKKAACPQIPNGLNQLELQDENCLFLDIYRPKINGNKKIPIYVWIHGGDFNMGSAFEYDASFIAATQGVMVVVVQYRLGYFGFYSSEQKLGNYGLWDMVTALRWVHQELGSNKFDGDLNDITIAGESAGGASVSSLLHFDAFRTNGLINLPNSGQENYTQLFHKVHPLSGVVNSIFAEKNDWENKNLNRKLHEFLIAHNGEDLTAKLGLEEGYFIEYNYDLDDYDEDRMLKILEEMPTATLVVLQTMMYRPELMNNSNLEFSTTRDELIPSKHDKPFVHDDDFFPGYGWLRTYFNQNSDNLEFNDQFKQQFFEKNLYQYTNFTNYQIKYGFLNGESHGFQVMSILDMKLDGFTDLFGTNYLQDKVVKKAYFACQYQKLIGDEERAEIPCGHYQEMVEGLYQDQTC